MFLPKSVILGERKVTEYDLIYLFKKSVVLLLFQLK